MERRRAYWAGKDALLALALWEGVLCGRALEDAPGYYGNGLEGMDASQLLSLIQQAKEQLSSRVVQGSASAPSLFITRDYRIFIGGRRGKEIRMRPMAKAVFLLFLKHPEGIAFSQVGQHRQELAGLYRRLSNKGSNEEIERCLSRVLDAASREVNIAASRAAEALSGLLEEEWLPSYVISGEHGGRKRILLDRRLVVWL